MTELSFKDNLIRAGNDPGDEWRCKILDRVQNFPNLIAVDAKYHNFCVLNEITLTIFLRVLKKAYYVIFA